MAIRKPPEHVRCENCAFWAPFGSDIAAYDDGTLEKPTVGECRRYPPTPGNYRISYGLAQIALLLSRDETLFEEMRPPYDPDSDEGGLAAFRPANEWCGEFKAEWPE